MSAEANKAVVKRIYEGFFSSNIDELDELFSPNLITYNPDVPWADDNGISWNNLKRYKSAVEGWRIAYPDGKFTIKDIIAEGDKIAVHVTFEGTLKGQPASDWAAPDNKRYRMKEFAIFSFVDGKVSENHRFWGKYREV